MSNRLVTYMTVAMVAAVLILFLLNVLPLIQPASQEQKWIRLNDVKGVDIYHKELPYTLNFDQQTQFINYLNRAEPFVDKSAPSEFPFEKAIIYQFNAATLEFKPIALHNDLLVFSLAGKQFKSTESEFYHFLTTTYDQ